MGVRVIAFYAAIFRIQQFFLWGKEVLFSRELLYNEALAAGGSHIVERILKTD